MSGGKTNKNHDQLDSTEIFKNEKWTCGPKLPVKLSDHCQVQYGNTHIITGESKVKLERLEIELSMKGEGVDAPFSSFVDLKFLKCCVSYAYFQM